eukprot:jgi/Ulvmu1/3146/UM015_0186.1
MAQSRFAALLWATVWKSRVNGAFECGSCQWMKPSVRSASKLPPPPAMRRPIPNVRHVLLVGSGKGGVGKSTTAVNIALSLARTCGLQVGVMDADVSGPSIPHLLNLKGIKPQTTAQGDLIALQNHGIVSMSMGSLVDPGKAIAWRGPMVGKALEQLLFNVVWGQLDVLVVDLPPGTGDTHISLAQRVNVSGALVVTTPQDVALEDVTRSVEMFHKMKISVSGIVENMSHHVCDGCGKKSYIFGTGGAAKLAELSGVQVLGHVPLDVKSMEASERGVPIVVSDPESPTSQQYHAIAKRAWANLQAPTDSGAL